MFPWQTRIHTQPTTALIAGASGAQSGWKQLTTDSTKLIHGVWITPKYRRDGAGIYTLQIGKSDATGPGNTGKRLVVPVHGLTATTKHADIHIPCSDASQLYWLVSGATSDTSGEDIFNWIGV